MPVQKNKSRQSDVGSTKDALRLNFTKRFVEVQTSRAKNSHNLKTLQKIEQRISTEEYQNLLMAHIDPILQTASNFTALERIIRFAALVAVTPLKHLDRDVNKGQEQSEDDEEEQDDLRAPAVAVVQYCIAHGRSANKNVRLRACELIYEVLKACEQLGISSYLFDTLVEVMIEKALDKNAAVRVIALKILFYLQEGSDEGDEEPVGWDDPENSITDTFVNLLSLDSNHDVRKTALELIVPTACTLEGILVRCQDVKENVRETAYNVLGQKLKISDVPRSQRIHIIKVGLEDRDMKVKKACQSMLMSWLEQKNGCCLTLLNYLHVISNSELALKVLDSIFHSPRSKRPQIYNLEKLKLEDLTPAGALYWRALCSYTCEKIKSNYNFQDTEEILPNLSDLCNLVKQYTDILYQHHDAGNAKLTQVLLFVLSQMFQIAITLDLTDEVGRARLSTDTRTMLCDKQTPEYLIETLIQCLIYVHPENNDRSLLLFEMINQVCENSVDDEVALLGRCLQIFSLFLEKPTNLTVKNGLVVEFIENMIIPGVQNADPNVRYQAIKCLGLCSLTDLDFAKQYLLLFTQIIKNDLKELRVMALQVLFDLVMTYGAHGFGDRPNEYDTFEHRAKLSIQENDELYDDGSDNEESMHNKVVQSIMPTIYSLLSSDDEEIQAIAGEGMAKLLLTGRTRNPYILRKLIVLYFDPNTQSSTKLIQCLSVFFPAFAFSSIRNQLLITDMYMSVTKMFFNASSGSSLSTVKLTEVAQFMVYLTSPDQLSPEINKDNDSAHNALALILCRAINRQKDSIKGFAIIKTLCRVLPYLYITFESEEFFNDLVDEANELSDINDKVSLTAIHKFHGAIEALAESIEQLQENENEETAQNGEDDEVTVGCNNGYLNSSQQIET